MIKDSSTYSLANKALSEIIFNEGELINFDIFSSSSLTFGISNLGYNHYKAYFRVNGYSSCSGLNESLIISVDDTEVLSATITSSITVVETTLIEHTLNSVKLTI